MSSEHLLIIIYVQSKTFSFWNFGGGGTEHQERAVVLFYQLWQDQKVSLQTIFVFKIYKNSLLAISSCSN